MTKKEDLRCAAHQSNRKAPDFYCTLKSSAHNIHVDPRTGTRWGDGSLPRGWNRKWSEKKYANSKLQRRSSSRGRA